MADEPVKTETSKESEAPLTSAEFMASFDALVKRAKAAGVRPLEVMATTYLKQGMGLLDGMLAALEEGKEKGEKKE